MSPSAPLFEELKSAGRAPARPGADGRPFISDEAVEGQVFCQVLGSFHEEHHRRGYSEGYRRAISDVLAEALASTEEFLRFESPHAGGDPRQLLYRFNRFLEARLLSGSGDGESVSDGLGI